MANTRRLTDEDYERLLEFRTGLRTFLTWSKNQAAEVGLAPSQHQLLLAIRGHSDHVRGPTVGDVARHLLVKHHSAVELVDRAAEAGLVERLADSDDRRVVRLRVTPLGERKLRSITGATLEELARMGPSFRRIWRGLEQR